MPLLIPKKIGNELTISRREWSRILDAIHNVAERNLIEDYQIVTTFVDVDKESVTITYVTRDNNGVPVESTVELTVE